MEIITKSLTTLLILFFTVFINLNIVNAAQQPLSNTELTAEQLKATIQSADKGDIESQLKLGQYYFDQKDYQEALKWYEKAEEKNNITAIKKIGDIQVKITNSCRSEIPYMFKAAELGDAESQNSVATYYSEGYCGFPRDQQKAMEWYQKAVEQNNARAQYNMGIQYEFGKGGIVDPKIAASWYQKSAEQGHAKAQANLADLYLDGNGVKQDINKGLYWLEKSAAQGYYRSQYYLGALYKDGIVVPQDNEKAFNWILKSAKQNYSEAEWLIGVSYLQGQGVTKDTQQAYEWLQKAAKQNHIGALLELGLMYAQGIGIPQDYEQAYKIFMRIEEIKIAGNPCSPKPLITPTSCKTATDEYTKRQFRFKGAARNNIAYMYESGFWVKKDINTAIEWYKKSAEFDYVPAMIALGNIYSNSPLTKQDLPEAMRWYKEAAENGSDYAQVKLGLMYLEGAATAKDETIAKQWFNKAAKQGNQEAKQLLKEME